MGFSQFSSALVYLSVSNDSIVLGTASKSPRIFGGTNASRDAITIPEAGMLWWSTTNTQMQNYNGSSWVALGGGGGLDAIAEHLVFTADGTYDIADTTNRVRVIYTDAITMGGNLVLDATGQTFGPFNQAGSTYWRIGPDNTGHSLSQADDFLISGKLEINGATYFDDDLYIASSQVLYCGGTNSQYGTILGSYIADQFAFGSGVTIGRNFVFGKSATDDFEHAVSTNPTVWIHSVTDPSSDATEWLSFLHDQADAQIATGKGDLSFIPFGITRFGGEVTGHSLTNNGDVIVNAIEANGASYFDSTLLIAGITTVGSNIISDTDSTDDLGTTSVRWANLYVDSIGDTGQPLMIGAFLAFKNTAGITASVTQTQGQQQLISDINEISVCANDNDVVTLPDAGGGCKITVINNGTNTLQIFPASGNNLGEGVDLSVTLAAGELVIFVAWDATNWDVLGNTQRTHGEMTMSQNATETVVSVASQEHSLHTATLSAGLLAGWAFDAGGAGTVYTISSIADGGGGEIDVTTSAPHGLSVGDIISITNTSDANYDLVHVVASIGSTTVFGVTATFTATGTGSMNHAATLTASGGSGGTYHITCSSSATTSSSNITFEFLIYKNGTAFSNSEVRRKYGTGGDYGSTSVTVIETLSGGDVLSISLQNNDSASNITLRNFNLAIVRI